VIAVLGDLREDLWIGHSMHGEDLILVTLADRGPDLAAFADGGGLLHATLEARFLVAAELEHAIARNSSGRELSADRSDLRIVAAHDDGRRLLLAEMPA